MSIEALLEARKIAAEPTTGSARRAVGKPATAAQLAHRAVIHADAIEAAMRTGKPLPKWPLKATSPERRTERSRKRRAKLAEAGIREVRGIYAPARPSITRR